MYVLNVYRDRNNETRWTAYFLPGKFDTVKKLHKLRDSLMLNAYQFFLKKRVVGASSEGYKKPKAAMNNASSLLQLSERFDFFIFDQTGKKPRFFYPARIESIAPAANPTADAAVDAGLTPLV